LKKISTFISAMAVIAALVTGCGGSSSTGEYAASATATASEESQTAAAGPTLTIANMAFGKPLTVAPGTEITIVNNDTVEHSVTSQTEGAFDVHVDGGKSKTLTAPTEPGQYQFHCVYHPTMKGTLIVQ
jgi:plastocyanin